MSGIYVGATWTGQSQRDGDAIIVKGTWSFVTRPRTPLRTAAQRAAYQRQYLERMATQGYKIGMRLRAGQRVDEFSFRGTRAPVVLRPSPEVSDELRAAFPADPAEQWVGLVPPPDSRRRHRFVAATQISYNFTLRISPFRAEPQPLPVVLTHAAVPFAEHYLLDVFTLSGNITRIESRVDALK